MMHVNVFCSLNINIFCTDFSFEGALDSNVVRVEIFSFQVYVKVSCEVKASPVSQLPYLPMTISCGITVDIIFRFECLEIYLAKKLILY